MNYIVVLLVSGVAESYYVDVDADTAEQAAEYGKNMLENEWPMYAGKTVVRRTLEQ